MYLGFQPSMMTLEQKHVNTFSIHVTIIIYSLFGIPLDFHYLCVHKLTCDIMKRFAFKMFLKPGCEKEYERRHAAIWPELVKMIKDGGVSNYSIYWDKDTNILFGYQECEGEGNSQDTENVDPITQKWWDMMADIMEVNPDNSPVTVPIQEVFHLD